MGEEREVEVEIVKEKSKKKRSYEERMMRALAAINGNLERIANATETIAEALGKGAQVENPLAAATAALGNLFTQGTRGKKGRRR